MAAEDEVRHASERFYAALNSMANGDASPMSTVLGAWRGCDHPAPDRATGGRLGAGAARVGAGSRAVQRRTGAAPRPTDPLIRVGMDLAYEVTVEEGEITMAGERVVFNERVTNIYRREGGAWTIVHHHSDPSAAANDLVSRLQPPSQ